LTTHPICTERPGATIVDVELTLPATPVALAPGVPTRVPVELRNPGGRPISVRLSVARGRVSGWAWTDPDPTTLPPGGTATIEVVLRAPADQPPSLSLVPFTVAAAEAGSGEPAGYATGLLTIARPAPIHGELVRDHSQRHAWVLLLGSDSDRPTGVRITAELDPPAGSATVEPAAIQLEAGETSTATVRVRPARPLVGSPKPLTVIVEVRDAADPQGPPLLAETGAGSRRPWVPGWAAATAAIVLALGATAALAFSGVRLQLPGHRGSAPAAAAPAVTPVTVTHPYALVDVIAHSGADGGRAAAEAERTGLVTAGMPVRLVDSLASDQLTDDNGGFWVLLQDGFGNVAAATDYCTRWRPVAPKCQVVA
jgi:hypothetical protein